MKFPRIRERKLSAFAKSLSGGMRLPSFLRAMDGIT
jgi:hypothetical protein